MKNAILREGKFNLKANTTGEDSRVATYEIGDFSALMLNKNVPYDVRLVTKYTETGVDLDSANVDIDVDEKVPDKPYVPDDGGIAVAYYSTDGGTSWTQDTVGSINYYTASSNPNRITLEADVGETGCDIKIYHLFTGGALRIVDVPVPTYGTAELELDNIFLSELNEKKPHKGPFFGGKLRKLPRKHRLIWMFNSSVQISWDDDAKNAGIKTPVTQFNSEELARTPEQLHNDIIADVGMT